MPEKTELINQLEATAKAQLTTYINYLRQRYEKIEDPDKREIQLASLDKEEETFTRMLSQEIIPWLEQNTYYQKEAPQQVRATIQQKIESLTKEVEKAEKKMLARPPFEEKVIQIQPDGSEVPGTRIVHNHDAETYYHFVKAYNQSQVHFLQNQLLEITPNYDSCCTDCTNIIQQAITLGATDTDIHIISECFYQHPLSDFANSHHFNASHSLEIDLSKLINEIFESASLLSNLELKDHFLTSIVADVKKRNHPSNWARALVKFDQLYNLKINNYPLQSPPISNTSKAPTICWAFYYFYLQSAEVFPWFENHELGKMKAIDDIVAQHSVLRSPKNFQLAYNQLIKRNQRLQHKNIPHITEAIQMLESYPKAREIAQKELETLKNR